MKTEAQIRNSLIKKVLEIPAKELKRLSDFVSNLESKCSIRSFVFAFVEIYKSLVYYSKTARGRVVSRKIPVA